MEVVELLQLPTLYIDTATESLDALKRDKNYEEEMAFCALEFLQNVDLYEAGYEDARGFICA